jgi:putative ABC transport system substrate-binding protein
VAAREAAKRAGISLKAVLLGSVFSEAEYRRAFRSMDQDRADALMVSDDPEQVTNRMTIVELAEKVRIPTMYPFREFVEVGGLMAYAINQSDLYRRLAIIIDDILRGLIREISRFTNRPNLSWSSISRLRKRSASKCPRCCSAAPTR